MELWSITHDLIQGKILALSVQIYIYYGHKEKKKDAREHNESKKVHVRQSLENSTMSVLTWKGIELYGSFFGEKKLYWGGGGGGLEIIFSFE